jgi:hypothetical protein
MADKIEFERPPRKRITPELTEIADDIDRYARIHQETGTTDHAANLRDWARELRQKRIRTPY